MLDLDLTGLNCGLGKEAAVQGLNQQLATKNLPRTTQFVATDSGCGSLALKSHYCLVGGF